MSEIIYLFFKYLQVQVLPALLQKPPRQVSAFEKDDILLECKGTGHPEPDVKWYKNGDLIIESEYFQVNFIAIKFYGMLRKMVSKGK